MMENNKMGPVLLVIGMLAILIGLVYHIPGLGKIGSFTGSQAVVAVLGLGLAIAGMTRLARRRQRTPPRA